ncbi:aggrecan core protein-like isoform X2 [Acropora millepora]|uniref:aggrecan core protein-like isoform X2 n=1 Tax=Acropora millepora TaxID=45264 RepID=UPI001CF42563|nr:aggrecan core protein-like isoform X2 [Acropora millepora]
MEKISVFLFLVGVLEFLSKNPSFGIEINNKCSTLFHKVKGKALSGHVISVHQASSEIACTHKCLSNPKCASFNFEIQQSRSLSTCELNAVSRTSPHNKLKSRHGFAYYEPLTLNERPKQEITAFSLIMAASTIQCTQEASPTQDQASTPASRVPSTQPATTAAPISNCGQQWHAYRSGCLRLFEDYKSWVDANQHCATFNTPGKGNGRLISIFSQDDNNRIVNLRSSQGFSQGEYYIGLNDLQGTGTYKWADGTNASFTNWNTGFPKGGKGVVMKRNGNSDDGKWQTKDTNKAMRLICECPDGPCASQ